MTSHFNPLRLPTRRPLAGLFAAAALALAGCGGGGGPTAEPQAAQTPRLGASELAVLIAAGDATSEAIGVAYQKARGIPEANMVRVTVAAGRDSISAAEFATLKAAVDARLPATAQATLVTWTQPSRVGVAGVCEMGLTSALAFGYDARWCGGCLSTAASAYYDSASHRPWDELKIRPSMMLGAATLADAQALIARGVAADGTLGSLGTGTVKGSAWFVRTTDNDRSNPRQSDFALAAAIVVPGLAMHYIDNTAGLRSNLITGEPDVMFYLTGMARVDQITSNRYLPGAVADHLTSHGGVLPDGYGQMPATDWLRAGVTGSYGTVEEPCAYAEKFPRATVLVKHYEGGDALIEAYWKSVLRPGQGLFVGEPLARPWNP